MIFCSSYEIILNLSQLAVGCKLMFFDLEKHLFSRKKEICNFMIWQVKTLCMNHSIFSGPPICREKRRKIATKHPVQYPNQARTDDGPLCGHPQQIHWQP
jgi:hypothetical protein